MTDDGAEQDLALWVVTQVAPEEQPLFGLISDAYKRDPDRMLAGAGDRDEMLAFGIDTATVLLTPVILAAVNAIVRYLIAEMGSAIGVQAWLRRILRSTSHKTQSSPSLNIDQLARVREIVLDKCRQAGLPENKSRLLADAVVGALSTGA